MADQVWKRLKESETKQYGGMLPARVVLEHNEADRSYRTCLETFSWQGEPGYKYGRYFYREEEALEDFNKRVRRLLRSKPGPRTSYPSCPGFGAGCNLTGPAISTGPEHR